MKSFIILKLNYITYFILKKRKSEKISLEKKDKKSKCI